MFKRALVVAAAATFVALGLFAAPAAADHHATGTGTQNISAEDVSANKNIWM